LVEWVRAAPKEGKRGRNGKDGKGKNRREKVDETGGQRRKSKDGKSRSP
jgi:hypothetical protein